MSAEVSPGRRVSKGVAFSLALDMQNRWCSSWEESDRLVYARSDRA